MDVLLWMFCSIISQILATHGIENSRTVLMTYDNSRSVLHRHKRDWRWNTFYMDEEKKPTLPHLIGKLSSTKVNGSARFVIEGEGANTIFKVDDVGDIYAWKTLDREEKSIYHLRAQIFDKITNKQLEPTSEFEIKLNDVNDNAPRFTHSIYNGSVKEMSKPGTTVLQVIAVDPDDSSVSGHARVTYSIIKGGENFHIDLDTGIITSSNILDREQQKTYELVVKAKDMPGYEGGFSSTASVIITLEDINDNAATFTKKHYTISVLEDKPIRSEAGMLQIEDKDEPQNTNPMFSFVKRDFRDLFDVVSDNITKNAIIVLKQPLDYEKVKMYTMEVEVTEITTVPPGKREVQGNTRAMVFLNVLDVDEPPVFQRPSYFFSIFENASLGTHVGTVSAEDPDEAQKIVRYSINGGNVVTINKDSGSIKTSNNLDREMNAWHNITITAVEDGPGGKESTVSMFLKVLDINDNSPILDYENDLFVCANARPGKVIKTIAASDKDEMTTGQKISFYLDHAHSNFSLVDNHDNTANITLKQGGFNPDEKKTYFLPVVISDNGRPQLISTYTLNIVVCGCDANEIYSCTGDYAKTGVSGHALAVILLCIVVLVITLLIAMRRNIKKDSLATLGKSSGEIHEQLVSYDEEGGGEMDTNGYDVSVLNSARHNSMRPRPEAQPGPCLYATVQKPAAKGEMAVMIEVKKDEADHDRDGIPYDTLHIYGYEGSESLAGSLSSLESASSDSDLDYDFLNDWGPRFNTLAELYGVEGVENGYEY
ncbi:cadherin-5-like [Polyodon spathula]|nr:cadherin-5-like [Polyodon spathula]XP_041077646.1 cadherin-5-like [Polyodon spathula]XP_041077647.1 cadherin-5-like [Polyodon spathula]XP_041077648.1 cadherin-5-like [Polyodon spathula]XP_041077649.1 cadherin-5-like [Polyodon spathula]